MSETEPTVETSSNPVDLVSQAGFADVLGVTRQRVHQLKEAGDLPAPYGVIDERYPVWDRETAEQFSVERNRTLGKISLGD